MPGPGGTEFSWWDVHWMTPLWELLSALERLSSLHPVSVIARKRLDVSFQDLGRACRLSLAALFLPGAASGAVREETMMDVSRAWSTSRSNTRSSSSSNNESSSNGNQKKGSRPGQAPTSVSSNETNTAATSATSRPTSMAAVAPFLSVRTAFDLYLRALKLPRGSVVICSALTIPDIVTIFEEHGLVLVPVDLDPDTLAPGPGALEDAVERCSGGDGGDGGVIGDGEQRRRVRAIYVAHVFGAQVDMTPVAGVASRHGLLLWEDCAQVFTGLAGYLGHPESDAAFFSFGVIKRATALGGGVARIRDATVMSAMLREEAEYPVQSTATYLRRVCKCSLLLAFSTPLLYGIIIHTLGLLGIEHDEVVMKLSKGFPKKGLLKAIRHRASVPLLQMLAWRISRYSTEGVEIRLRHCNRMLDVLETALVPRTGMPSLLEGEEGTSQQALAAVGRGGRGGEGERGGGGVGDVLPGINAHRHTLWLYPVVVKGGSDRPRSVVGALLREGFDATQAPTSLIPIERCTTTQYESCRGGGASSSSSSSCLTPRCSAMMDSLVYLPLANNIPDSEVDRMALALARALLPSNSLAPGERRLGEGRGGSRKGGSTRRERTAAVARSLIAFAFRLDVIVVSTVFLVILVVPVMVLACLR